jgi:hypothetical protein
MRILPIGNPKGKRRSDRGLLPTQRYYFIDTLENRLTLHHVVE